MVDPTLELERLRYSLRAKGVSHEMINLIVGRATSDIDVSITDAVAAAVTQAIIAGVEKDAEQFITEIRANKSGNTFTISTDSGRTDFSNPPFPMLPWLLKNAKIAEDGTRYKIIPIGAKSKERKVYDIAQVQERINDVRKHVVKGSTPASGNVFTGATIFSGDFAAQKAAMRADRVTAAKQSKTGKQEFRTATSKQDSGKSWVLPAQEKDMSRILADINESLKTTIENAIIEIIRFYMESY